MENLKSRVSVRLSPGELDRIKAIASERSCSQSDALRYVLSQGFETVESGIRLDPARTGFVLEFVRLALEDVVMARRPDRRDELLESAWDASRKYHAKGA